MYILRASVTNNIPYVAIQHPRFRGGDVELNGLYAKPDNLIAEEYNNIERQSPEWFMREEMINGVLGHYKKLKNILSEYKQPQEIIITPYENTETKDHKVVPVFSNPEYIVQMQKTDTAFRVMHLDPFIKQLAAFEKDDEKLVLLRKKSLKDIEQIHNRLHDLIKPLAKFLAEPEEQTIVDNVNEFQKQIDIIKSQTSEWFASKGLTKAVIKYYNQLQKIFDIKPIVVSENENSGNNTSSTKKILLSSSLDQTLEAWREFNTLKKDNDYLKDLSEKESPEQLEQLHRKILYTAKNIQETVKKLFNLTKLLEKLVILPN